MTLILTEISTLGIVMAADSAVTQVITLNGEHEYKVLTGVKKLQVIDKLNAGIAVWGEGTISLDPERPRESAIDTDLWLRDFIRVRRADYNTIDEFATLLQDELRNYIPEIDATVRPGGTIGFLLAGYVDHEGQRVPSFYHIHNGESTTLSARGIRYWRSITVHTLELNDVSSGYNGQIVLHNISFKLQEPSIYVVLGPNGAGKTTLFRTIAGILEPYSGKILLDEQNLTTSGKTRTKISYLSQYNAMPEEMTVYDALKFYSEIEGGNPDEVINLLDLGQLKNKRFSDLSQGQKKRAAIAKVFLHESDLYLLDEPTANLDPAVSKEIRDIILKLSKDKMILYSSHNLYEATDIGTYLILIKNGSVTMLDRISNIKPKNYRVGIRASTDITGIVEAKHEGDYYVLSVSSPEEAGLALKKIVERGVLVTEMRQLDNPLQELFETSGAEKAKEGSKNAK